MRKSNEVDYEKNIYQSRPRNSTNLGHKWPKSMRKLMEINVKKIITRNLRYKYKPEGSYNQALQ